MVAFDTDKMGIDSTVMFCYLFLDSIKKINQTKMHPFWFLYILLYSIFYIGQ